MATFAFIHGGGDVGWYWHLVERELHGLGHQTVAPDLPCDDDTAGHRQAVAEQSQIYGGLTGSGDPYVAFYHDVPRALADEALSNERSESETACNNPWPLDAWPAVPTKFIVCTEDRFFPAEFMRRVVAERLGIVPDEIASGHCVALSRPRELASLLAGYAGAPVSGTGS